MHWAPIIMQGIILAFCTLWNLLTAYDIVSLSPFHRGDNKLRAFHFPWHHETESGKPGFRLSSDSKAHDIMWFRYCVCLFCMALCSLESLSVLNTHVHVVLHVYWPMYNRFEHSWHVFFQLQQKIIHCIMSRLSKTWHSPDKEVRGQKRNFWNIENLR